MGLEGPPPDSPGSLGFWDAHDIIHCTDGRARRIEPGSFPLATGIRNRVGRLRAYGNAINPYVAAEFIRAYLGVTEAA
jgi:DNA (cytosine-5)-methyltransferase 1